VGVKDKNEKWKFCFIMELAINPLKTAVFRDPVRTAL